MTTTTNGTTNGITNITAIAFDWGGVFTEGTFDSSAVRNLAQTARVSEEKVGRVYYPLMEHFEAGAFDFDTFYTRFAEASGLDLKRDIFERVFLESVTDRLPMFALLGAIPASYRVGMLSNNVPVLCDRVRRDPRLARIEHFVFSNEIGVRKPDPAAFAKLSAALEVPAHETVFIDDNEANISAAQALGFHALYVDTFDGFMTRWRALLPDIAPRATRGP